MSSDEAIQATNDDASECKRCAVDLGYWKDNYLQYFVKHYDKKAPEINRGYFARVSGIDSLINTFIKKCGSKCQIINLGSGFDTLYWKLKEKDVRVQNLIEVDYPAVTSKKCYTIKRNTVFLDLLNTEDLKITGTELHSQGYHIVGSDLRNNKDLEYKLIQCGVSYDIPTLFIAECVLVYIEMSYTQKLLLWISSKFRDALFVNYEQININDRFGEIMIRNLRERGCSLAGSDACQSLETQKQRFLNTGWNGVKAWDMTKVYSLISASEKRRIESIEFLDEQEVLQQLLQHYAICVAWKGERFKDIDIT